MDIFNYIGGVPTLLVFDNATGVGHRIMGQIHETELFARFRAHYGFRIRFCNPYAGYEKGNVENKVGTTRRNLFVPIPTYHDIEAYNLTILACCKSLFLTSAIPELIKQDGTPKQIEYLAIALQKEITRRDENKKARLVKRARFPIYKTFEGYEYRCVKLPPALCKEELESVSFIKEKNNLVLYGPVGIGKTHMAIAIGVNACMKGYNVRFYTVTELVLKLAEARKNGTSGNFRQL